MTFTKALASLMKRSRIRITLIMEYIPSSVSGSAGFTIDGCSRAYRCSDETMQGLVDHIHYPTRVMADEKEKFQASERVGSAGWVGRIARDVQRSAPKQEIGVCAGTISPP